MKKINVIRIMVCVALLVSQFTIPTPVSACSCVLPGPPIDAFRDYAAVFRGKVTEISRNYSPAISHIYRTLETLNLRPNYFYENKSWGYDVTFKVYRSWKNVGTTSVILRTGSGGGDCGYVFNRGDDYLVYAYELNDDANNELEVSMCSRTTEISGAAEDLSYLNTIPTLPLTSEYNYPWLYFAGIILFVIVISVRAIIVLIRRQQPQKIGDHS
jgi:hypothetical protein